MISPQDITGLVLAGGRGSRMGGVDKGLQNYQGMALALHALMRLSPQVGSCLINANRNLSAYESFGAPVWPDSLPDFAGPLAGFMAGLEHCETPYLVTVPCDSPRFPEDLVARLAAALEAEQADIALVETLAEIEGETRRQAQPVFCLMKASLLESLARFTQSGQGKIMAWVGQHRSVRVHFEDTQAFANANTLDDLQRLQRGEALSHGD